MKQLNSNVHQRMTQSYKEITHRHIPSNRKSQFWSRKPQFRPIFVSNCPIRDTNETKDYNPSTQTQIKNHSPEHTSHRSNMQQNTTSTSKPYILRSSIPQPHSTPVTEPYAHVKLTPAPLKFSCQRAQFTATWRSPSLPQLATPATAP